MKRMFFALVALCLIAFATKSVAAQKKSPTPTPTPITVYEDYSVVEITKDEPPAGFPAGRFVNVEIELGKKRAANKSLIADIKSAGVSLVGVTPYKITLRYETTATDCQIFADATRISQIVLKYFPKNTEMKFGLGIMDEEFYSTLPNCGKTDTSTTPSPP